MLQLSVKIGVHDEDAYYFQPRLFGKVLHEFHDFMALLLAQIHGSYKNLHFFIYLLEY